MTLSQAMLKAIKTEILETAAGKPVAAAHIAQDDIMDMVLAEYFNPNSRAPKEMSLQALASGASMMGEMPKSMEESLASMEKGKEIVKAVLAKYETKL